MITSNLENYAFSLTFRPARSEEAEAIAGMVNAAYRGDSSRKGWTTEADLLDGQRTDAGEIRRLIEEEGSRVLLCLGGDDGGEMLGSVHLRRKEDAGYLGMLVVRPELQGQGLGKRLIEAAEDLVRREWGARKMTMSVITRRQELFAFYGRRGYRRTGRTAPFPKDVSAGIPLVPDLEFEFLEKDLSVASAQ